MTNQPEPDQESKQGSNQGSDLGATWYLHLGCGHVPRVWTAGAEFPPGADGRYWCFTCREVVGVRWREQVV